MRVVLASNNPNKLREIRQILAPLGWEILLQRDLGLQIDPEETGETFEENSALKAVAVMREAGIPAIADDSGIEVDALNGEPGVYSARYGGVACRDDHDRNLLLLKKLENVPDGQRAGRFVSVITMAMPDGRLISARGTIEGELLREEVGDGGFGYDPLFWIPEEQCTMAQLTAERKNEISHRANALKEFLRIMNEYKEELC